DIAGGIQTMSRMFERLFRFPKPTVAAVNGHAIAGGAVLMCACDYRVASAGDAKLGFSELAVGVPLPRWALEVLRLGVGSQHARNLALSARNYSVDESLGMGMVDEVAASDQLMAQATRAAQRLARV